MDEESKKLYCPDHYRELLYDLEEVEEKIKLKKNHDSIIESIRVLSEFLLWGEKQSNGYFE